MRASRFWVRVTAVSSLLVMGIGTAAFADSGTFTRQPGRIVFFYDISSGNALSNTSAASPGGTDYICEDAPGATSTNTFSGDLYEQRAFATDPIVVTLSSRYADARRTKSFTAPQGATYKARSGWSFAGNQTGTPSGYVTWVNNTSDFNCDLT